MTRMNTQPGEATATNARSGTTRALLNCGAAAGALFLVVSFAQVVTRSGFDLRVHPLSALSLGSLGWLQITNFLVTGILAIAFAAGIRRALHPERAGTWGPILVGAYGVGLVGAGVFVTDPGFGFPPGAPAGMPEQFSMNAILHALFAMVAFVSVALAGFVFARRFASVGQWTLAIYSVATGVVSVALTALPWSTDSASLRFAVGAVLTSAWLAVIAVQLRSRIPAGS